MRLQAIPLRHCRDRIQASLRSVQIRYCDRAIQRDDRRWFDSVQLIVMAQNPAPIRGGRVRRGAMTGRNSGLHMIRGQFVALGGRDEMEQAAFYQ